MTQSQHKLSRYKYKNLPQTQYQSVKTIGNLMKSKGNVFPFLLDESAIGFQRQGPTLRLKLPEEHAVWRIIGPGLLMTSPYWAGAGRTQRDGAGPPAPGFRTAGPAVWLAEPSRLQKCWFRFPKSIAEKVA